MKKGTIVSSPGSKATIPMKKAGNPDRGCFSMY